ncbi:FAD:protein FMN transferase [Stenotrophomonas sp. SRS1]|uniref:FAD:protein FMN transferase n=1 Tax=Stenotrophomonas sp. SRS1 TaxID=2870345 RepID=UPI0022380E83|nr:FAD:protein FMN transferase [Stenotrophomonas sp. SRS1]MCW6028725.1 FAD:protein FMN transferase [Stenotrophomonas sp. SRS1]
MNNPDLDIASLGGHTMGTTWQVKLAVARSRDLHPLHAGIQAQLDAIVTQMSTWEADSDIARFNRASAGEWQTLPPLFDTVMQCALDIAQRSGGAFDPTIGPLVALWGFGAQAQARRIPDAATLAATRARCGWERLHWQPGRLLQPGGLALDLSAIAKGFGVDQVSTWLRENGVHAALVEVGGELHGFGHKPDGQPWRVLVESAPEEDAQAEQPPRVLALRELAVATSGDRWHHFERSGEQFSHTLDPRTGAPVTRAAAAVTVVADSAMQADAWATALTVMGPDEGIAFARTHALAARVVSRGAHGIEEHMSPAFEHLLADDRVGAA